jgi:hypothetical protein
MDVVVTATRRFDGITHVCHDVRVDSAKLTIRLRDQRLYGLLKLLAAQRGVSMNRLVEEALAHELELQAVLTEETLEETLALLRFYRSDPERLARELADAELAETDPLRTEPAVGAQRGGARDPLGALTGFDRAA